MPRVLVIHGPNLNMLGMREPDVYGSKTLDEINKMLEAEAASLGMELRILQSNHEGEIVEAIQRAFNDCQAIVINPAGYTHTSVVIRDAIAAVRLPTIEVHLSNIWAREEWREKSMTASVCVGVVAGFQAMSYVFALRAAHAIIEQEA
ncbi:MAG: type II 3-dehydroquinate dehydratase [Armatimonadetes bacterium]|nr:type II 3-dehydroquinate dehydratase [Armatimonadota bacterium]MDI9585700.1 type II 3-dehydroquinate dehydratase [Acidobacteriota bacterium]